MKLDLEICRRVSMLGFHCISKNPMQPKSAASLFNTVKKYKLPVALQSQIKAQVSENANSFIRQILSGDKSCTAASLTHPQLAYLKMTETSTQELGYVQELNPKEEEEEETSCSRETKCSLEKGIAKKSKGKRRRNQVSESSEEFPAQKRKSPNYFVAVQITDPQIHSIAKEIQEKILAASEVDISSTKIDPATFHITLMVMHLESEEAVRRAEEALEKLGQILGSKLPDTEPVVEFKGLSVFGGGRVVFTPPQPSPGLDSLTSIAEETVIQMKENGIYSTDHDNKVFRPHLTLFKFKDNKQLFKQGIRKIRESLYAPFREQQFGFQKVSSIQLCQMGEKREDGYYAVNKQVSWLSANPP
ncbi:hypothetical protein EGW08_013195 [Elysia chlorotica]|uniref:A-kinase anchor protein 7-like phosphoesterase domain-containing protein n=1 Tax=Elysia chlorotica TaxID=188477 RepID=A0A433TBU1_ELYCH|nr:hypothetical protein EGW08_013195 [Elysia chlorotica]